MAMRGRRAPAPAAGRAHKLACSCAGLGLVRRCLPACLPAEPWAWFRIQALDASGYMAKKFEKRVDAVIRWAGGGLNSGLATCIRRASRGRQEPWGAVGSRGAGCRAYGGWARGGVGGGSGQGRWGLGGWRYKAGERACVIGGAWGGGRGSIRWAQGQLGVLTDDGLPPSPPCPRPASSPAA